MFSPCFQVAKTINVALRDRPLERKLGLIIFVESAIGLLNLKDVCQKGTELSLRSGTFQLEGVVFGSDDFCADIGKVSFQMISLSTKSELNFGHGTVTLSTICLVKLVNFYSLNEPLCKQTFG